MSFPVTELNMNITCYLTTSQEPRRGLILYRIWDWDMMRLSSHNTGLCILNMLKINK